MSDVYCSTEHYNQDVDVKIVFHLLKLLLTSLLFTLNPVNSYCLLLLLPLIKGTPEDLVVTSLSLSLSLPLLLSCHSIKFSVALVIISFQPIIIVGKNVILTTYIAMC